MLTHRLAPAKSCSPATIALEQVRAIFVRVTKAAESSSTAAGEPATTGDECVVASHEALFARPEESRCDACGRVLAQDEEDAGHEVSGKGAYLWTRGDEVTIETVPLCASCASAIGMTALARWEIEEEEG